MFGTASYGHCHGQNSARSYLPDLTSCSFREGPGHNFIVHNRSGSGLGGVVRFWLSASGPEASRCSRIMGPSSRRTQPARYHFPTFSFGYLLPQTARIILWKTSPDPIWFWLTVSGFGQTDPFRKQAGVQESSGQLLAKASGPIRIGCGSDPVCLLGVSVTVPLQGREKELDL